MEDEKECCVCHRKFPVEELNEWFFDGQLYCDECYEDEDDALRKLSGILDDGIGL